MSDSRWRLIEKHAASVAAVVASLAIGLIGVLWQADRAALERDIAQRAASREEAVAAFGDAVQLREQLLWSGSWELAEARARLGEARLASGDGSGAALLEAAARTLTAQLGETHPQAMRARQALAMVATRR